MVLQFYGSEVRTRLRRGGVRIKKIEWVPMVDGLMCQVKGATVQSVEWTEWWYSAVVGLRFVSR